MGAGQQHRSSHEQKGPGNTKRLRPHAWLGTHRPTGVADRQTETSKANGKWTQREILTDSDKVD